MNSKLAMETAQKMTDFAFDLDPFSGIDPEDDTRAQFRMLSTFNDKQLEYFAATVDFFIDAYNAVNE